MSTSLTCAARAGTRSRSPASSRSSTTATVSCGSSQAGPGPSGMTRAHSDSSTLPRPGRCSPVAAGTTGPGVSWRCRRPGAVVADAALGQIPGHHHRKARGAGWSCGPVPEGVAVAGHVVGSGRFSGTVSAVAASRDEYLTRGRDDLCVWLDPGPGGVVGVLLAVAFGQWCVLRRDQCPRRLLGLGLYHLEPRGAPWLRLGMGMGRRHQARHDAGCTLAGRSLRSSLPGPLRFRCLLRHGHRLRAREP